MSHHTLPQYRIIFDRIGRNHGVEPLVTKAADADDLADKVHRFARKHLRSRDYDVDLNMDKGEGFITCGMHCGGRFTITRL